MTTIQGLIAAKRLRIESRVGAEGDLTYDLIDKLSRLSLASGIGGGGGSTDTAAIEQKLTTIIANLPVILGANLTSQSFPVALPTDGVLPLPMGAASSSRQDVSNSRLTTIAAACIKPNIQPIVNGTIAGAGISQLALPAQIGRQYIEIFASTAELWINIGADAGLNIGIRIPPNSQSWFSPSQLLVEAQVNIWSDRAGVHYCAIQG